jgi:cbb3-type cytochrome oxidase subunit 3
VLNQSSTIFQIVFFLVLVCVFDSQARISPRGEVNRAAYG